MPLSAVKNAGFIVRVENYLDGRAALVEKLNDGAPGEWSGPSYVTGDEGAVGPYTDITFGPVTTLPAGTPAYAEEVPIGEGAKRIDLFVPAGADGADGEDGADGTGTGDMVGPASSTAKRLAVFADVTGKLMAEAAGMTAAERGQARYDVGADALTGMVDLLINGMGRLSVRTYTTVADDTYWCDRHYVLTQTAAITPTVLSDVANGLPSMMRLTQSQTAAQRMGNAQIIEGFHSKSMRGQRTTLAGRLRCSSAQAIRYAVLEWTGSADTVTSDVVSSWTNGTFTTGQFFLGSNLVVAGVGSVTPAAATLTDFELVVDVSAACNNLIVFYWTEGVAAQNVTLDVAWSFLVDDWTAGTWPYVKLRNIQQEISLCQRFAQDLTFAAGFLDGNSPVAGSYYNNTMSLMTPLRAAPSVTQRWNSGNEANLTSKNMIAGTTSLMLEMRSLAAGRFYATPQGAFLDAEL